MLGKDILPAHDWYFNYFNLSKTSSFYFLLTPIYQCFHLWILVLMSCLTQGHKDFFPLFYSTSYVVWGFIPRSITHFELRFYVVRGVN